MERHLLKHLLELREEVLNGQYRPGGLRQFTLRKADGRLRVLSALTLRDKLLQRAVLTVLDPLAERLFHVDSYAYRKGRGVHGAIAKARERISCGLPWLVDADIRSFFDTIPHGRLRKSLRGFVTDKDVLRLVDQWLDMSASQTSLLGRRRGIPQGAILSPLLCNLYLHPFDTVMHKANIPFVRYADDFLLFTPSQASGERALAIARKTLKRLDLELHPEKTQVVEASPGIRFLGERLPGPPTEIKTPQRDKTRHDKRPSRG